MSQLSFQDLVQLYRATDFVRGSSVGLLRLDTAERVDLLTRLTREDIVDETAVSLLTGDPDALTVGESIRLNIGQPRTGLGLLAKDVSNLIESGRACEPKHYFVIESKFCNGDAQPPAAVIKYRKIIELITLVAQAAAFLDFASDELVFIREGRFSIPVRYSVEDLDAVSITDLDALLADFSNGIHKDQKLEIMASTIFDLTRKLERNTRFRMILASLPELRAKINDGYRLFASAFSYDKIRSDIQDAKIEFTTKIHKTFTDIQNQVLSIPVATVIVATQMKHAKNWDEAFWVNTGLLIGSWIFGIITTIMLINQTKTLNLIKKEVKRQESKVEDKHRDVEDLFATDFIELMDRIRAQRKVLLIIGAIVITGLTATHVVYAHLWEIVPVD